MNRTEEYSNLLIELEAAPTALEYTLQRAQARRRRNRVRRFCGIPIASLAGIFSAFVLLVNISVPFAMACSGVPALKGLTAAVAISPSLKAAVEHDYVQYIGQRQTVEGLTMVIDYVIADKKQANLFYHFESDVYTAVAGAPRVTAIGGAPLEDYSLIGGGWNDRMSEIFTITLDFSEGNTPPALHLSYDVERLERGAEEPGAPVAQAGGEGAELTPPPVLFSFSFDLQFDPAAITQGDIYAIHRWITLDGQRILVENAEIYPTHLRVTLADDPDNTAWLKGLTFYVEDEQGQRNAPIGNGISASGSADSPFMASMHQESTFFWQSGHLTLHITGAEWLDKDRRYVTVDLNTGSADWLPEGVSLTVEKKGQTARFSLRAPEREAHHSHQVMSWTYLDPDGGAHSLTSMSSQSSGPDGADDSGHFYETFSIPVYDWDTVRLELTASRFGDLAEPVAVTLK